MAPIYFSCKHPGQLCRTTRAKAALCSYSGLAQRRLRLFSSLSLYVTQRAKGLRPAGYFVIVSSEKIHHGGSCLQMGRENKSADATGRAGGRLHGLSNAHQHTPSARERERKANKAGRSICQRACQSNFCSLLGLAMGARGGGPECDLSRISSPSANVYCARAALSEERRATRTAFYCSSDAFAERGVNLFN